MKQCYTPKDFKPATLSMIATMNRIIREYQDQGFVLTVRQLYYQLVARDIVANTLQEYKRVASTINDGKLAGLIDWAAIEDRTRDFVRRPRWTGGADILNAARDGFHMDMWDNQDCRPFVIVEKEALVGVLEGVCNRFDVPLLAARGYPSGSVLREFAVDDIARYSGHGQSIYVFHLGDHDPSGIDMSRDLQERLSLFAEEDVYLKRLALNMDQVEEQSPPENPAKTTDSRFAAYRKRFGGSSWELDALSPQYLANLIEAHVSSLIDDEAWTTKQGEIEEIRRRIGAAADTFTE